MQRSLALGLAWLALASPGPAADSADYTRHVQPFFQKFCWHCHNAQQSKGEFRLDNLSRDFTNLTIAQQWSEVLLRLNAGEMPPRKEPQPKAEELGKVVEWISARIKEGEAGRMAKRGPVAHYRLSREEYGYTIQDLLGVYFDVHLPGAFNEDPRWHGFERIGSLLTLSPSHVERYFKAAETIVARAFPEKPVPFQKGRRDAQQFLENKLKGPIPDEPIRILLWPGRSGAGFTISSPGKYKIRVQLSALPSFKGRVPYLGLWHQGLKRSVMGWEVLAAEEKPTTLQAEIYLPEGAFSFMNEAPGMLSDTHTLGNSNFPFVNTRFSRPDRPTGYQFFLDDGRSIFPLVIIDSIEWEGPLVSEEDHKKPERWFPGQMADMEEIRERLTQFAERAWRRPTREGEIDRYLKIFERERQAGESIPQSYRAALVGLLTSKNFYYLEEGSATERRVKLNDWELASRLSYFLWSSLPDETLLAAAREGTLTTPKGLRTQLVRMLNDPKIERFTESFPRQWLQLHRVGAFPPDPELYPDYDRWLEKSMVLESTGFFNAVFRENLSVREFLASDWTLLNSRLAFHYALPPLKETGFQKVKLRPQDHRGGLLTQASVLSLTSDGTRHRPVHRGVWVSEAIFGRTPPPPPPNVEPLEPTPSDRPKATIRMQLEAHATHAVCSSCHRKIDPLGFAFDNFDALGRWRNEEKVQGGQGANPPVDAGGTLPDGRSFQGPDDFRRLLSQDLDVFAEAFIEQLATYALRRVLTLDDAPAIKTIAQASQREDYRLRTVIENLLQSELFLKR